MGEVSFIFQYLPVSSGNDRISDMFYKHTLLSGKQDTVIDLGFMSVEVILNEFIKIGREERETTITLD